MLNGTYQLRGGALSRLQSLMLEMLSSQERDPLCFNGEGELRVSWLMKRLQAEGFSTKAAEMGAFGELNSPDDLAAMESFLRSSSM